MKYINVLYRLGRDLILFKFNYPPNGSFTEDLIRFHFEERHCFEERVEFAESVFKDFYEFPNDGEPELLDYEPIKE